MPAVARSSVVEPTTAARPPVAAQTFLALGQRYAQSDAPAWRVDQQITVAKLDRDHYGIPRVTFRRGDGRELTLYTAQIEAAIADGQITPIVGRGIVARC